MCVDMLKQGIRRTILIGTKPAAVGDQKPLRCTKIVKVHSTRGLVWVSYPCEIVCMMQKKEHLQPGINRV